MENLAEIKSFGTNLRKIREKNDLSQQQLADMANVAKITIQRIENAKFSPTLDVIVSIAKALNVPPHQLLKNIKISGSK
ncbi:MAG: helix-turn-helix domain-containing protein [Bacteroidia bacterium]